ncbi:LuxR C-terminal-related transcriptional regulator [Rhodococcus kronopolitis]|uniref:LuxR C-terminal-related transcriptional regulator n=1 Tax=Rhodococcus kronopolitis TaxID=1460226 RepID=A0ABV9FU99_9NOCA
MLESLRGDALTPRPRLFERIAEGNPLTVIGGPLGSGKSALVHSWLATPQAADLRAVTFAAPDAVSGTAGFWDEVDAALRGSADDRAAVLVLDLPERIGARDARARIRALLRALPGLRVIVTTRVASEFATCSFPDVESTVILGTELAFTVEEVAASFVRAGVHLDRRAYREIHETVGGHAALVTSAVGLARAFDADFEYEWARAARSLDLAVDRYVYRRILDDPVLAPHRSFLLSTAVARTLTVEVALALTGDGARERISTLERAGVLVRAAGPLLDEWRYPAAYRASLVRAARAESGVRTLPQSAVLTAHFHEAGDLDEELFHAVDAGLWDRAASILRTHWVEMICTRPQLVWESLAALPPEALHGSPALVAARDLFRRWESDKTRPPHPAAVGVPRVSVAARERMALNTLQLILMRLAGEFGPAAELAARESESVLVLAPSCRDSVGEILPLLRLQWGITRQLAGDLAGAADELRLAYEGDAVPGAEFVPRNAAGALALNYALAGEYLHAERWLEAEARFGTVGGWVGPMVRVPGLVARALVAVGRSETERAAHTLAALGDPSDREELWGFVTYAHCLLALATGEAEHGLDRIRRATAVYGRWLAPGAVAGPLLASVEVELGSALGRASTARTGDAYGLDPVVALARARADFLAGDSRAAAEACVALGRRSDTWVRTRLEAVLLGAAALHDLGDGTAAGRAWRRAVAIAEQTGAVGAFSTVPAETVNALAAAERPAPGRWRSLDPGDRVEQFPAPIRWIRLTERESAVLRAVSGGATVAEVAVSLYVSPNTVKTQLQSMYRKLGVHTRAEAIRVAREIGLV